MVSLGVHGSSCLQNLCIVEGIADTRNRRVNRTIWGMLSHHCAKHSMYCFSYSQQVYKVDNSKFTHELVRACSVQALGGRAGFKITSVWSQIVLSRTIANTVRGYHNKAGSWGSRPKSLTSTIVALLLSVLCIIIGFLIYIKGFCCLWGIVERHLQNSALLIGGTTTTIEMFPLYHLPIGERIYIWYYINRILQVVSKFAHTYF